MISKLTLYSFQVKFYKTVILWCRKAFKLSDEKVKKWLSEDNMPVKVINLTFQIRNSVIINHWFSDTSVLLGIVAVFGAFIMLCLPPQHSL